MLVFAATPPVLDGHFGLPPLGDFVLMGKANLDPLDGQGRHNVVRKLLADPRLQDPTPRSAYARDAVNPDHIGEPALDTADWSDPVPGNLRVDYVLPSAGLRIVGSGVVWPPQAARASASRHGLVLG